jgi:hypothetical protein
MSDSIEILGPAPTEMDHEVVTVTGVSAGTLAGYRPAPHPYLALPVRAVAWTLDWPMHLLNNAYAWLVDLGWRWSYRAPIWRKPPTMTITRGDAITILGPAAKEG